MRVRTGLLGGEVEPPPPVLNQGRRIQVGGEQLQRQHGVLIVGANTRPLMREGKKWDARHLAHLLQDRGLYLHGDGEGHVKVVL